MLLKIGPWLFPTFVVLGFVLIFNQNTPIAIPTILVLIYAGLIYVYVVLNDDPASAEHYIESIYFLGFLFTLIALSSLFFNSGFNSNLLVSPEDNLAQVNEIVKFIGIKIWTTIAGLVSRNVVKLLYAQRHQQIMGEPEIVTEMRRLREYSQEFTSEYKEVFKSMGRYLDEREKELSRLNKQVEIYSSSLEKFSSSVELFCEKLEKLEGTIASLNQGIGDQKDAFASSKQKLQDFDHTVQKVADHLDVTNGHINTFNKNVKSLNEVLDDFIKLVTRKVHQL